MKERKRVLTESQLRKEKRRAAQDATGRAMMLMLLAAQDELDLDEQTCEEILVRAGRYAHHYDEHLIRMQDIAEAMEKQTGMALTFWKKGERVVKNDLGMD